MNTTQTAITIRSRLKRCHACRSKVKYTVLKLKLKLKLKLRLQGPTSDLSLHPPLPPSLFFSTIHAPRLFCFMHACMHVVCALGLAG
ncbi:hypothetical protein DL95DRAFT_395007 [Leptodontidium sp. 2 PMI_412]|nr:hypothetical protein DL95DRAFT_395007 [Leptodontidium sp. 2 PMI_412]